MPFGPVEVTENYQDKYLITGGWQGENTGIMIKFKNSEIRPRNQAIRVWVRTE